MLCIFICYTTIKVQLFNAFYCKKHLYKNYVFSIIFLLKREGTIFGLYGFIINPKLKQQTHGVEVMLWQITIIFILSTLEK